MTLETEDKTMKLLLISDGSDRAAMLRQLMEQQGLRGEIHRMDQGRSAIAAARGTGPFKGEKPPDLVMIDFSAPNRRCLSVLSRLALGSKPCPMPVILLTSPDSEDLLRSGELDFDATRVFAPTNLLSFVRKMRQHSRRRFLRALRVMASLGPVLVRLPESLLQRNENETALTA